MAQSNLEASAALGDRLFGGSLWMIAMSWAVRLLGLVSIAVLARLLDKDDFGLVAMAMAFVALPQVLLDVGVEQAVIRQRDPKADIYNTAWTIRSLQMGIVAAAIFGASASIADFYSDERVTAILQILSISVLIRGLENTWVVAFRKDLNFARDFLYNALAKLLSVIVTISLAVWLRSYWALVYGQLVAAGVRVILSFTMTTAIARPTLRAWRDIWSFSQWTLVQGLAIYVVLHGDRLLLGRLAGSEVVGAYTVSKEIANMPISEISGPANRVLGPGYSQLQTEPQRLALGIAKGVGAVVTAVLPIGIGLALTAEHLIPFALGPGWSSAVPILQLLALAGVFSATRGVLANTLVVIGHIKTTTAVVWLRALLLLALGIPAASTWGGNGIAAAFLVGEILAFVIGLAFYRRCLPPGTIRSLSRSALRPVFAVVLMTVAVLYTHEIASLDSALLLIAEVATGILVYITALLAIWRMAGGPDGIERIALERLISFLGRKDNKREKG